MVIEIIWCQVMGNFAGCLQDGQGPCLMLVPWDTLQAPSPTLTRRAARRQLLADFYRCINMLIVTVLVAELEMERTNLTLLLCENY